MPFRHPHQARPLLALVLALGVLPSLRVVPFPAGEPPAADAPAGGCCPAAPVPACPACPAEGRPSCPAPPARAAACRTCEALLPREGTLENREPREESRGRPATEPSLAAPVRAAASGRRAEVLSASPPVRLLAATFRN